MAAKFQFGDHKHEIIAFYNSSHTFNIGDRNKLIIACCSGCKIPYNNALIILQYIIYVSTEKF